MTTEHDVDYQTALGSRAYIAPVSPWFFCHLATSADFGAKGKNWLFVSEDLLFVRWEQLLTMQPKPAMVELVTWNDLGESHYFVRDFHVCCGCGTKAPKLILQGPVNRNYPADDDGSGKYSTYVCIIRQRHSQLTTQLALICRTMHYWS